MTPTAPENPNEPAQAGETPKAPEAETDDDILKEARERRKLAIDGEGDNYKDARSDLEFLKGGAYQWDEVAARIRTAEKRPMLTINNLPTFLHQVTNEQRQNKPGVKVHPVDDGADVETAEVEQGLIRHIEYDSTASVAYDRAVNSAAGIGFGWFRLITQYESEDSFDQKIMFKSIRNALSVHIDPLSQELDGSDMKYCFIDSLEPRKEFEKAYPKAKASDSSFIGNSVYQGWLAAETVLVCEYYRIKATPAQLCLLSDGTKTWTAWKDDYEKNKQKSSMIIKERTSARCQVEWFKVTGTDILERTVIKCKWIPVFPVYGDEIDVDGKVTRFGIIRNAKDPFRMYNYAITTATEEISLRSKTPWVGAVGQFETSKQQWQTSNQNSYAFIEYDPVMVDEQLAPPPQRQPMADVPQGFLAMAMHAADNKKATMGLFDSSLGARGTATSGIQEREQQQQGDTANFHFTDNLNLTVRHVGRCLVDMVPHYYDGARTVRILGEDETAKPVKINQPFQKKDKAGAVQTVTHDLTVGKYDVTVSAGPSFSTKREEAAQFLTAALQANKDPRAGAVLTYLAFRQQDLAGAEDATQMLKKLLPPEVVQDEPTEEGAEPTVPTPEGPVPISKVGPLIEKMGIALQNADKAVDEAALLEKKNKERELAIKQQEADTKKYEAETARKVADAQLIKASAEAAVADERLIAVAQSAAREAVSLVGQIASEPPPPDLGAVGAPGGEALGGAGPAFDGPGAGVEPPPVVDQPDPALAQPPGPL